MTRSERARYLDQSTLLSAVEWLAEMDDDLARVVERHGPPPLWARRPGFSTMIQIILEQQVSLASGAAVFRRIQERVGIVSALAIRRCGEEDLRKIGVTRQKASYCVAVAEAVTDGSLDFVRVARSSDLVARKELERVKGIGPWTSSVYLVMALRRPDVWPLGDIALHTAIGHLRGLPARPSTEEAAEAARDWSPWRAVAARILWHGYLSGSLRRPTDI